MNGRYDDDGKNWQARAEARTKREGSSENFFARRESISDLSFPSSVHLPLYVPREGEPRMRVAYYVVVLFCNANLHSALGPAARNEANAEMGIEKPDP